SIGAWGPQRGVEPAIRRGPDGRDGPCLVTDDTGVTPPASIPIVYRLGPRTLDGPPGAELLFTDNETNGPRVFGPGHTSRKPHVKDAFHRWIIHGEPCVNPAGVGTKAALHYRFEAIPPGGSMGLGLRLSDRGSERPPLAEVDAIVAARRAEADAFFATIHPRGATADERLIQRQALAGLLWSKQSYIFDV